MVSHGDPSRWPALARYDFNVAAESGTTALSAHPARSFRRRQKSRHARGSADPHYRDGEHIACTPLREMISSKAIGSTMLQCSK
jgi:hypothetical protein